MTDFLTEGWEVDDTKKCNIYANYRRSGKFFGTDINGYEGIPQNLVLNVAGWIVMILVFSVLRKKAWNYGRIALIHKNEMKWTDMFYGNNEVDADGVSSMKNGPTKVAVSDSRRATVTGKDSQPATNGRIPKLKEILDTGLFSWIKIVFTLTDQQYLEKCGPDCVQYLSFQRHLIFLSTIITITALIVVLPINLQTKIANDGPMEFSDTTIINLDKSRKFLWVHVILAVTFLFLSIAVMRHFSRALKFVEDDPAVSRTVMIIGIAKKYCDEDKIRRHFQEIYPDVDISEITFAYDISKLQYVEFLKLSSSSARVYWEEFLAEKHYRPTMRPYTCGAICCCCEPCGCKSTDAIEYYAADERKYTIEVELERQRALTRALGIAFVTFKTLDMAERVVGDYRFTAKLLQQTPESKYTLKLKSKQWIVKFAPLPDDLYWENLTLGFKAWYFKIFLVNITLAIVIVIFTTPVFLLNSLSIPFVNISSNNTNGFGQTLREQSPTLAGILVDTFPTILLWIGAVTLPSLVSVSDRIVGFWTKTAENRSKMIKIFSFLIFMVIILPSLGMTSLSAIMNRSRGLRWPCIFSKDNGALFVNYVCTSTFLGSVSELMRIPELFVYCVKLCFARSEAEIAAIRKSVLWDFQIGSQYAWMMLNFAIFTVFSLIFPLVTPFGLVYLLMKHFVDRYNMYFAYAPTKVEKEVHGTAINFVIVCMFMLQINLLAYVLVHLEPDDKTGPNQPQMKGLKVFSVVGFCITAALFMGQVFFNMCANFSPILYKRISQGDLTQGGSTELPNGVSGNSETAALCRKRQDAVGNNTHSDITPNGRPTSSTRPDRPHCKYFPPILRAEIIRAQQQAAANNRTPSPSTSPSVVSTDEQSRPLTKQIVTTVAVVDERGHVREKIPMRNGSSPAPERRNKDRIHFLIGLFAVLRKKAWNYGRMAVMQKNEMKWADMFYAGAEVDEEGNSFDDQGNQLTSPRTFVRGITRDTPLEAVSRASQHQPATNTQTETFLRKSSVPNSTNVNEIRDHGYFTWITLTLKLTHIYLWAHVSLSILFLLISVTLMRRFSKQLRIVNDGSGDMNHTVMIIGMNRKYCKEAILKEHLSEIYPLSEVTEISFAYDISKVQRVEFKRLCAASAKLYCEEKMEKTIKRPTIRPYFCGAVGCCCRRCGCMESDAIEYYAETEKKLKEQVEIEKERAIEFPLGIAFVTFATAESAGTVVDDYAWTAKACLNPPRSKHAKNLNSKHWIVRQAPLPEEILWANLSLDYKMWYVKCLGINILLLLLVVLCTTPVLVLSMFSGPMNKSATSTKLMALKSDVSSEFSFLDNPTAPIKPDVRALQLVAVIAFCVTTALFLGQMCFNACADFSPIHHFRSLTIPDNVDEEKSQGNALEPEYTLNDTAVDMSNSMLMHEKVEVAPKAPPEIVVQSDLNMVTDTDHPEGRKLSTESSENSAGSVEKFSGRYIPPLLRLRLHNMNRNKSAEDLLPHVNSREVITTSDEGEDKLHFDEVQPPPHGHDKK
ncbi:unnamed protein product [Orchesella dallaii]|uniref:CSC1-like protein 2 n=1 Tax=Orchesella dallaii TaxID=48710 RepID=A0ABP1QFC5_9HEXA